MSVNKKYKDGLFRMIFGSEKNKQYALELYNSLNGSHYKNIEEFEFTTIEDVVYMGIKNDVSFLIQSVMALFEHQSSFNPNMPIRGLMYYGRLYDSYISKMQANRYGSKLIKLPRPQYIVFYNGRDEHEDLEILHLSDAFEGDNYSKYSVDYEWTAVMLNINKGRNKNLMEQCKPLADYSEVIDIIETFVKKYGKDPGISMAIDDCIERNLFKDILLKNKAEVIGMFLTHYDEKEQIEIERAEAAKIATENATLEGIKNTIISFKDAEMPYDKALNALVSVFKQSPQKAKELMDEYWK